MLTPRRRQWANCPRPIEAEVAVAGNAEIDEVPVRQGRAGEHGGHAPMNGVEPVARAEEVGRRLRGASDSELRDPVRRDRELEAGLDDRGRNRVVPAAGTERRHRAFVVAPGGFQRILGELGMVQLGLRDKSFRRLPACLAVEDRSPARRSLRR